MRHFGVLFSFNGSLQTVGRNPSLYTLGVSWVPGSAGADPLNMFSCLAVASVFCCVSHHLLNKHLMSFPLPNLERVIG